MNRLRSRLSTFLLALCSLVLLLSCETNPVTGKNQLSLMGPAQEVALGQQQYAPSIQSQGGEFKHDPALTRYVKSIGARLAKQSDRQLPYEFTIINSSEPNAWALPGGKIAINRGMLLEMDSEAELAAVLGHEIVHAAAGHSKQQLQNAQLMGIGLQVLGASLTGNDYAGIAMQGAQIGAQIANSKYSQSQELEADTYGMKYMSRAGFNPKGAVEIQETFLRLSQQRGGNSGLATLFSSHPPSATRVQRNKETLKTLPHSSSLGTQTYKNAISKIKRLQPAYDLYDKGVKAASNKQYSTALSYAKQAISRFSSEGQFYELKGFAQEKLGQNKSALSSYNSAVSRNSDHFSPYLRRGLLYKRLGNRSAAEKDFVTSYNLLPAEGIKKLIIDIRSDR